MFGIGPTEFIIIAVVALMLFSPRELPKMLRSAAKFWASLRNTADEFRDAIMNEEELQDIRGVLKGGAADLKRAEAAARRELMKARMEMQKAQNKLLKTVKAAEESQRQEIAAAPATGAPATGDAATGDAATGAAGAPAAPGLPAAEPADAPTAATEAAEPSPAATAPATSTDAEPAASLAPHGAVAAARPDRGHGAA